MTTICRLDSHAAGPAASRLSTTYNRGTAACRAGETCCRCHASRTPRTYLFLASGTPASRWQASSAEQWLALLLRVEHTAWAAAGVPQPLLQVIYTCHAVWAAPSCPASETNLEPACKTHQTDLDWMLLWNDESVRCPCNITGAVVGWYVISSMLSLLRYEA